MMLATLKGLFNPVKTRQQSAKLTAIVYAILAAALSALNLPLSKLLLQQVSPTAMASVLYLGAGIGIGGIYLLCGHYRKPDDHQLTRADLPYTVGMIVLDIAAPILLMIGLKSASAANASLLNNFEIVATTLIALMVFKEAVSVRLWLAILLITAASMLLSLEQAGSLHFTFGSLFILGAAVCWGLENNLTRKLSSKSTFQIVTYKGIFSGIGAGIVAVLQGEAFPPLHLVPIALLLGFVAFGLSIFYYVRAQKELGAAKTSAYYALAPYIGAILSFVMIGESLSSAYVIALVTMLGGSALMVADTLTTDHKTTL